MSGDEGFLSRWSRRKLASKAPAEAQLAPEPEEVVAKEPPAPVSPESDSARPAPPIESLTPDSDFEPFMKPDVDADLKRRALKKLFDDPRFNVMDGLDVYIDDYSKPDPLPEGWLAKLNQVARLGSFVEATEGEQERAAPDPQQIPDQPTEQSLAPPSDVPRSDTATSPEAKIPVRESPETGCQ